MGKLEKSFYGEVSSEQYFIDFIESGWWHESISEFINEACRITEGLIIIKSISEIFNDRSHLQFTCIFGLKDLSDEVIEFKFKLKQQLDMAEFANQLNSGLKNLHLLTEKYFFDISEDVGFGGLAFAGFEAEQNLVSRRILYRGYDESFGSEGYEDYWNRLNIFNEGKIDLSMASFLELLNNNLPENKKE